MTLSDTQSSILRQALHHPDGFVVPPAHLPPGPRASIARALLNAGFVARAEQADGSGSWKLDGEIIWLSITDAGRQAIGQFDEQPAPEAGVASATAAGAATVYEASACARQGAPMLPAMGPTFGARDDQLMRSKCAISPASRRLV